MSDTPTPRTDAVYGASPTPYTRAAFILDLCRELERELAEAKADNAQLRDAGESLRDALAFECKLLGDCPREIDE